jgi:hypothetical protein
MTCSFCDGPLEGPLIGIKANVTCCSRDECLSAFETLLACWPPWENGGHLPDDLVQLADGTFCRWWEAPGAHAESDVQVQ